MNNQPPYHLARKTENVLFDLGIKDTMYCEECSNLATIVLKIPTAGGIWLCDEHARETMESIRRLLKPLF